MLFIVGRSCSHFALVYKNALQITTTWKLQSIRYEKGYNLLYAGNQSQTISIMLERKCSVMLAKELQWSMVYHQG